MQAFFASEIKMRTGKALDRNQRKELCVAKVFKPSSFRAITQQSQNIDCLYLSGIIRPVCFISAATLGMNCPFVYAGYDEITEVFPYAYSFGY